LVKGLPKGAIKGAMSAEEHKERVARGTSDYIQPWVLTVVAVLKHTARPVEFLTVSNGRIKR